MTLAFDSGCSAWILGIASIFNGAAAKVPLFTSHTVALKGSSVGVKILGLCRMTFWVITTVLGNNQENDTENEDVNPPPPRAMSFRLCSKSYWSRGLWLYALNPSRLVAFLRVMGPDLSDRRTHDKTNRCKNRKRIERYTIPPKRTREDMSSKKRKCGGVVEL
jgi:hypothetical protein